MKTRKVKRNAYLEALEATSRYLASKNPAPVAGVVVSSSPVAPLADVVSVVRALAGTGLADLVDVRRVLGGTREQQDRAINEARRAGLVTGTNRENRYGCTDEQVKANLDGIGFLSLRGF